MEVIDKQNARITICKHIFCLNCVEMTIRIQAKCPLCRTQLPTPEKSLVEPANEVAEQQEDPYSLENMGESSSKLDRLLEILRSKSVYMIIVDVGTRTESPDVKTIVFSQFTKFLDVIEWHLKKHGFTYVRLDGSMTVHRRDLALDKFSTSRNHTIMLASLAVCSVGVGPLRCISKIS